MILFRVIVICEYFSYLFSLSDAKILTVAFASIERGSMRMCE